MIARILNLGINDKIPLTQKKYLQVSNAICGLAAMMTLGYLPPSISSGSTFLIVYHSLLSLIYLSFLWLNLKGFYRIVRHGIAILTILFIFSMLPIFGSQLMGYIWFFPLIAALPIIFTRKENLALLIYEIISVGLFLPSYLLRHHISPIYIFHSELDQMVALTAPVFALLTTFSVVWFCRSTMINGDMLFEQAYNKAENLLLNILPRKIAVRLKKGEKNIADHHPCVSVMFIDIIGFNALAKVKEPEEIVRLLNKVFSKFDSLSEIHNVEKIKTIGDSYLVASGLPEENKEHAQNIARLALSIEQWLTDSKMKKLGIEIRIGNNSGPVVAGVIGIRKFIYYLW